MTRRKTCPIWREECCPRCHGTGSLTRIDGPAMREARKSLGLTLNDLGKSVGVSKVYLSDIELGRRNPSDAVLTAITRVLVGEWR